jgi:hypothetical protein
MSAGRENEERKSAAITQNLSTHIPQFHTTQYTHTTRRHLTREKSV